VKRKYLILILLLALALRLGLLLSDQRYVDGDEAVVGMMAKHILTRGERPLFYYGQPYGGGHIIEAYLTSFFYVLFGFSSITLKLVPLIFSLGIIALTYLLLERFFNERIAILSGLLLAVSSPFMKSSLKVNGYIETIFFCLLSLFLFSTIYFENKREYSRIVLFGLVCGLSCYLFDFALFYLLTYLLFFFVRDKRCFFRKSFLIFFPPFLLGISPLIWVNLKTNFLQVKHLIHGPPLLFEGPEELSQTFQFLFNVRDFFIHDLPAFHGSGAIHLFVEKISFFSWIHYLIFLSSLVFLIVLEKRSLKGLFLGLLPGKRFSPSAETWIICYFFIFIILYSFSPYAGGCPRFLLPLCPFIPVVIALFLNWLWERSRIQRAVSILLLVLLLFIGLKSDISLAKSDEVIDGKIRTSGKLASQIVKFLDDQDIRYIYTTYFLKWRIIFESNERIIASHKHHGTLHRYPLYERIVERAEDFAYVFHIEDLSCKYLENYLKENGIQYEKEAIDGVAIYYNFSEKVRPD